METYQKKEHLHYNFNNELIQYFQKGMINWIESLKMKKKIVSWYNKQIVW